MSRTDGIGWIIDTVNAYIADRDWQSLDKFVQSFDFEHEGRLYIIAVLRSTFPVRSKLNHWRDAVQRASLHVPHESLKGLLDK